MRNGALPRFCTPTRQRVQLDVMGIIWSEPSGISDSLNVMPPRSGVCVIAEVPEENENERGRVEQNNRLSCIMPSNLKVNKQVHCCRCEKLHTRSDHCAESSAFGSPPKMFPRCFGGGLKQTWLGVTHGGSENGATCGGIPQQGLSTSLFTMVRKRTSSCLDFFGLGIFVSVCLRLWLLHSIKLCQTHQQFIHGVGF